MKIALMSDCYLPRLGGIEVQVHDLASALVRAGHEVEVFTATAGSNGERGGTIDVVDGVPVHRMALPLPGGVPVNPLAPHEVQHRIEAGDFDVAHVHMGVVSLFATDMARVVQSAGVPLAVTWHCIVDRSAPLFRLLGHARRWAARGAALSAVSSMAAERVEGFASAPVAVLGNGIDVASWRRPNPPVPPGDGAVHIVSAARLAHRKRPQALLDVLGRAREIVPPEQAMRATIFGAGPMRRALERQLARRGMADWVALPGRVSRDELKETHWNCGLYLSAARLEAFGIAALEARTAGLPVVARAGTGVDDFITDGVNGRLATDDAGLAVALAGLVTDHATRHAIAVTNSEVPPDHDWTDVVDATLAEYDRARSAVGR